MKLTELISELSGLISKYGDINIVIDGLPDWASPVLVHAPTMRAIVIQ